MTESWLRVPITNGMMLIDLKSWPLYASKAWHSTASGYAVNRCGRPKKTTRFHRLVNNTPDGFDTDHVNQVRLDNRASNLRTYTRSENNRNSAKRRHYCWDKSRNKWMVRIDDKYVGRFGTEQEAIDKVKETLHGRDN